MTETTVVLGAAIVQDLHLFVARRSQPPSMAGYWELPGSELTGDDRGSLQDLFTHEFGVQLRCVDQIQSDRMLVAWRTAENDDVPASLRVWRCQFPSEMTLDMEMGDPRPNMYRYDDSSWVPIDALDTVGPWRDDMRIAAGEVADYYNSDVLWQSAD
jgi:8-oxo-dGTP diphosphatase